MSHQPLRGVARLAKITLASVVIAACVTINVYFPAAAAEKAADQIIDAVTGSSANGAARPAPAPVTPPTGLFRRQESNLLVVALGKVLYAVVPAAQAQDAVNLDISSPEIRAITASMQARFGQLQKFFDAGSLGMTQTGLIELRDPASVALPDRALINQLVTQDNKDRETLYTEIARANGHPEWAADIRKTFARRWVERGARAGWYYQNASGAWVKK
ncbi:MAG: YdbL family protein [Steroidobacteraceae bacterium]